MNHPSSQQRIKRRKTDERRRVFEEFSNNVTLHGFRFIFDSQYHICRRLIWLILICSAIVFAVFLFYEIVIEFSEFKSVTAVSTEYDLSDQIDFPTVTICPLNEVLENKFFKVLENLNTTDHVIQLFRDYGMGAIGMVHDPEILAFHKIIDGHSMEQLEKDWSLSFSDMTSEENLSPFTTQPCSYYSTGCTEGEFLQITPWFGSRRCLQYNSFVLNKTTRKLPPMTTKNAGLDMFLDLKFDEEFTNEFPVQGARVIISPYGDPGKTADTSTDIFVKPGDRTFIKLRAKKVCSLVFTIYSKLTLQ